MIAFKSNVLYRSRMAYLPFDILVLASQLLQKLATGNSRALDSLFLVSGIFNASSQIRKSVALILDKYTK